MVEAGHTVLLVEHDLDVIAAADWVVDLGPEAAAAGGRIVATGTPTAIMDTAASHTGRYLARHLEGPSSAAGSLAG